MEGENNDTSNVNVPQTAGASAGGEPEPQVLPSPQAAVDSVDDQRALVLVSGSGGELSGKRKRGRPRKQLTEAPESSAAPQKRARGRPKGSGKWQMLDSLAADSSGTNFTPHMITVQRGEDIVQRIYSFSQRPSDSLCIISAVGVLSTAELYRPGSYNSIVKYEGRFHIISLNGSHAHNGKRGVNGKVRLLSVQLAMPDGALFGGAVAGSLIVREPAQVMFATFKQKVRGASKARHSIEPWRPNNGAVAVVPVQAVNARLPGYADNSILTTVPPVPTPPQPVDIGVVNDNLDHVNRASSELFDWNSLPSSSQHMPMMSDVITGVVTD